MKSLAMWSIYVSQTWVQLVCSLFVAVINIWHSCRSMMSMVKLSCRTRPKNPLLYASSHYIHVLECGIIVETGLDRISIRGIGVLSAHHRNHY